MVTRQFAILLSSADSRLFKDLESLLKMVFYSVELRPQDYIILCRTNKPNVSLYTVKTVLCEHWNYVEDVAVKVVPDDSFEDLADEYGFITSDSFL